MKECQLCKTCFADSVESCPNDGMPTVHTIGGEPVLEGKYQLECRLGQGGMGVVYKARHAYLKTQLAIKVILPDLVGNDPQLVTRFRQEALAAAAIRHQNVVSVTDYGVIDGTVPFLVMEYVEGEALHDLLGREKSLSPERAFEMMSAVCAGVGAAHHQGIVHRDLKPLNIMICSDKPNISQAVKILDFGLAKIKSGELLGSFIQAQTTGLMGSPYYMAPEQWADEEPDSRSDIYSLGVMLFQMLTGDVPFKGSSIPAIMKKHISDAVPTLADVGLIVSPALERAVAHSLQKEKNKRTPTVETFVSELREAIFPGMQSMHSTTGSGMSFSSTGGALPVATLKITSKPVKASVFVDNVSVGETKDNGQLLLEGIQSGNHHLRISHNGFQDWLGDLVFDGQPQEVFAELAAGMSNSRTAIPRPEVSVSRVMNVSGQQSVQIPQSGTTDDMAQTVQQNWQPDRFDVSVNTIPPVKKKGMSAAFLGIGGLLALLLIGGLGIGGAYMAGVFGGKGTPPGNVVNGVQPTAAPSPAPGGKRIEMIEIPGGTFTMGRNVDGDPVEYGEHTVQVGKFLMAKTEVTNALYQEFTTATKHAVPRNWVNGAPVAGTEQQPVAFVSLDDAQSFARWLSQVEGGTYRLPTEQEWEYAARNGSKGNFFPWGNDRVDGNAIYGREDAETASVGSKPQGANMWGVQDLIGNVWEWTSTEYNRYPGNAEKVSVNAQDEQKLKGNIVIRGGGAGDPAAIKKISSSFRVFVLPDRKDKTLGIRLVKDIVMQ